MEIELQGDMGITGEPTLIIIALTLINRWLTLTTPPRKTCFQKCSSGKIILTITRAHHHTIRTTTFPSLIVEQLYKILNITLKNRLHG
jgi:hypothetical protein